MSKHKLAVVIPCFNKVLYTYRTIESLIACTHSDLHIIVVDDGCTDDTFTYAIELGQRMNIAGQPQKFFYHKNAQNIGVNASWNAGLRIAMAMRAEFICIANNDLMFTDRWDVPLISAIEKDGYYLVSPYSTEMALPADFPLGLSRHTNPVSDQMAILGACFMFQPKLIDIIGYFPEEMRHYFGDNWIQDQTRIRNLKTGHIYESYIHHMYCITSSQLDNNHWFKVDGENYNQYCKNFKLPE